MEKEKEFHPGMSPSNPKEEAAGFRKAIEATKKRIAEYKADGVDVSELEFHLKNLEQHLEKVQKEIK